MPPGTYNGITHLFLLCYNWLCVTHTHVYEVLFEQHSIGVCSPIVRVHTGIKCTVCPQVLVNVDKKIVTLKAFIKGVEVELKAQDTAATNTEELIGDIQADVDGDIARAQKRYSCAIDEVRTSKVGNTHVCKYCILILYFDCIFVTCWLCLFQLSHHHPY